MEFLETRSTVREAGEIYKLRSVLDEAADEAGLTLISLRSPIPATRVAEDLRLLSNATVPLLSSDKAEFVSSEGPVEINAEFELTTETIEKLLTQESVIETDEMILIVKKPDFLAYTMWDFRHNGKRVLARDYRQRVGAQFSQRSFRINPR